MGMWENLPEDQKEDYKKLILNFASLSEAFSQKVEVDSEGEEDLQQNIAPIVNSKFQETVFQRSFEAYAEDIGNTSYDASLIVNEKKYLIGLKSFGIGSGDQKIAQFKRAQAERNWGSIFSQISKNSEGITDKKEIDTRNGALYKELAIEISNLRNQRLLSSKENLRGFKAENETEIIAVYHYLMPSKKDETPKIFVGEVPYYDIDIANIVIEGCTSAKNPLNFKFTDGRHKYKYTYADSQLYMTFTKTSLEEWAVHYVDDPFSIFAEMNNVLPNPEKPQVENPKKLEVIQTLTWKIDVKPRSGFNQFMGLFKNKEKSIQSCINELEKNFSEVFGVTELIKELNDFKDNYRGMKREEKYATRDRIMSMCKEIDSNQNVINCSEETRYRGVVEVARKCLFRSPNEIYIPIPQSKNVHGNNPNFFGTEIAKMDEKGNLEKELEERRFKLEFLPSHEVIEAQIVQSYGKGIQSSKDQSILGKWILEKVFQLAEFEPLTNERLNDLEINGIRLSKFSDADNHIGLEFIWDDKYQNI